MTEKELSNTIAAIYDTVLQPERWSEVLAQLSQRLAADTGVLFTPSKTRQKDAPLYVHNISADFVSEYILNYQELDAWGHGAIAAGLYTQSGVSFLGEGLIDRRSLRRTEFYNDYLVRVGIESLVGAMLVADDPRSNIPVTSITFQRYRKRKDFGRDAVAALGLFVPHLQRAIQMSWRLNHIERHTKAQTALLDHLAYGLLILSHSGNPIFANGVAERILSSNCELGLCYGRRTGVNSRDSGRLSQLVANAMNGQGGDMIFACNDRSSLRIAMVPIAEDHPLSVQWRSARVLVTLHQQGAKDDRTNDVYATTYRLTHAETRVLALLLESLGPKKIAERLGVSIRTVRTQLSSIYTKTGTRGQRELVQRALEAKRCHTSFD